MHIGIAFDSTSGNDVIYYGFAVLPRHEKKPTVTFTSFMFDLQSTFHFYARRVDSFHLSSKYLSMTTLQVLRR